MTRNVLLVGGSLNQTMMMHAIARHLPDFECYFTPFYALGLLGRLARLGLLDFTILGGRHRRNTDAYLAKEGLRVDLGGKNREYDLIVIGTDTYVPPNILGRRVVLVQEGMIEPEGLMYHLVKLFKLPRYLANTATTGLSDAYDLFCVASPGYRDLFIRKGVKPHKIAVTGIPNYDNAAAYLDNDFLHHHFVLAATSSARESFKPDNRARFIQQARSIAADRPLIFKLHPSENAWRAMAEIRRYAPEAQVYVDGDVHAMIANCDVLITQYSTTVFTGIALGKEVHSYFDVDMLRKLAPLQNGGTSGAKIANLCRQLVVNPAALHRRLAGGRRVAHRRRRGTQYIR